MAINFKAIAQNELTLSHLMNGRTQVKTDEIVGKELTIEEFDIVNAVIDGKSAIFPVVVFTELPANYYNGGALLQKMVEAWTNACGGDVETASNAFKKEGGVKVKFTNTKTKSGNNLTGIEII